MLFKISIKNYITIIFSLFSVVKRYAVRNVKIRQYAVRKGGGGCHPLSQYLLTRWLHTAFLADVLDVAHGNAIPKRNVKTTLIFRLFPFR